MSLTSISRGKESTDFNAPCTKKEKKISVAIPCGFIFLWFDRSVKAYLQVTMGNRNTRTNTQQVPSKNPNLN